MRTRGFAWRLNSIAFGPLVAVLGMWLGPECVRAAAQQAAAVQPNRVPVLIELFTAEGCSSCPPADDLLGQLDRQPVASEKLIVLSEHVDYWNHDGWQDRFSSPDITERQKEYQYVFKLDDVYTPQMIVNGTDQMNGADVKKIEAALQKAISRHPIPLQITGVHVNGKSVTFSLRDGMPATPDNVNVYAALVDPEDTTRVRAGENNGRTLQHVGVVRKLQRIGGSWHTQDLGKKPLTFNGEVSGKPGLDGVRLVVFVQTKQLGPVVGADECLIMSGKADNGPVSTCPNSGS